MSAHQVHNSQVQAEDSKMKAKSNTMEKFLVGGGEKLLNGLDKRWYDEKFADLKIVCGEQHWMVHKVIVCAQCDFFENACKDIYKVRHYDPQVVQDCPLMSVKEGRLNIIKLNDDNAEMVETMLRFFYLYDYPSPKGSAALVFHTLVYAIADKYGVQGLGQVAVEKFDAEAGEHLVTYDFHSAIRLAWTTTPPQSKEMRTMILDWLVYQGCKAFKSLKDMKGFRELMADVSDFSYDLAVKLVESKSRTPLDFF